MTVKIMEANVFYYAGLSAIGFSSIAKNLNYQVEQKLKLIS